jgi:hypothetical protein
MPRTWFCFKLCKSVGGARWLFALALLAWTAPAFGQESIPTPSARPRALTPIPDAREDESWKLDSSSFEGPTWAPGSDVAVEMIPEEGEMLWSGDQADLFVPGENTGPVGRWDFLFGNDNSVRSDTSPWDWTILPDGLIYRSYLAGPKESRFRSVWAYDENLGWIWDITLGGRVGILRYGTKHADDVQPEGWQLDVEGAAFPRLDPEEERDLTSADFRFGVPLTYGIGRYQTKIAYYHLSSHIGDEYLIKNPTFVRRNYVRDAIVWGHSFYLTDDLRLYGEIGYAFYTSGGAEPVELQFGVDYSPAHFTGAFGAPFAAANGYLRQDFDFGGDLVVQAGWQWRGERNRHLLRVGGEYSNGKSEQFEFFDNFEERLGLGMWYDY